MALYQNTGVFAPLDWCETAVSPVHQQWRYSCLALSHYIKTSTVNSNYTQLITQYLWIKHSNCNQHALVILWAHGRGPMSCPHGRAMGRLLWVAWTLVLCYIRVGLYLNASLCRNVGHILTILCLELQHLHGYTLEMLQSQAWSLCLLFEICQVNIAMLIVFCRFSRTGFSKYRDSKTKSYVFVWVCTVIEHFAADAVWHSKIKVP